MVLLVVVLLLPAADVDADLMRCTRRCVHAYVAGMTGQREYQCEVVATPRGGPMEAEYDPHHEHPKLIARLGTSRDFIFLRTNHQSLHFLLPLPPPRGRYPLHSFILYCLCVHACICMCVWMDGMDGC